MENLIVVNVAIAIVSIMTVAFTHEPYAIFALMAMRFEKEYVPISVGDAYDEDAAPEEGEGNGDPEDYQEHKTGFLRKE